MRVVMAAGIIIGAAFLWPFVYRIITGEFPDTEKEGDGCDD